MPIGEDVVAGRQRATGLEELERRAPDAHRALIAAKNVTHVAQGYAITDPNKLILLTPGFDRRTGTYADYGIPAPVVAQYLRENRVVPEKNDLNSLLFLLTPGVEGSKAGTLLSALVSFKKLAKCRPAFEGGLPLW
jgi:arginine/lysine/ornithine decarboxylase